MKYKHGCFENRLTRSTDIVDKYIHTEVGVFKVRKNGRLMLVINPGETNEETVRVTPLPIKPKETK